MTITAAADGSALGNPGPAGWAWYVDEDHWDAGGWAHGTNNMGELQAVTHGGARASAEAVLELFRATANVDDDLLVLCDSQYAINSITKWIPGWKRKGWRKADGKPVLNVEILKDLDEAIAGRRYRFEWVRGHVGHPLNEAADERARAVATAFQRGDPIPGGPGFGAGAGAVAARPARSEKVPARLDEPVVSLFDLDADSRIAHRLTVEFATDEWDRLQRRARAAGVSPEALLRSLAARE